MLVSIKAQRPKTALRFDGSSLAKLVIQTHQNASSRSTFVTAASSPGARLSSLVIVCGVCALLLIGGNILSDGKLSVAGALSASSSAKPDERKSAQDGVVGLAWSTLRERGCDLSPWPDAPALPLRLSGDFGDTTRSSRSE